DVLLLDEPTRNLSPLSAPILRDMIEHFPGAVICITHDRIFLEETGAKVLELTEKGLYPGSIHPSKVKG
ncbi:MAG: ABC transporter ATP-binding protein, partial [Clostridia bacterium]|nr:ABC transporter ATP-binding protein [Clostridia bacterium]